MPHALPLPDLLLPVSFRLPHRTPYPGGAPANVVTGVARLGAGALFISAIGKDELGDDFVALLQSEMDLFSLQFGHGGCVHCVGDAVGKEGLVEVLLHNELVARALR